MVLQIKTIMIVNESLIILYELGNYMFIGAMYMYFELILLL